jgi:hypothetical protein
MATADPENLYKGIPEATGIIERRLMKQRMKTDEKFAAAVSLAKDEDAKKLLLRRESRTPPQDHVELVEYFLNTPAEDMEVRGWLLVECTGPSSWQQPLCSRRSCGACPKLHAV